MGQCFKFCRTKETHKGVGKILHGSGDAGANCGSENTKATLENDWLKLKSKITM